MNRTRTDILLISGFCTFLFFYGLGQFGLLGADEPRYAQVAQEMLARHDWITPVLGGQAWLEKPPLYYWQAMLAYKALGVSDTAARVPAAFDATFLVVGVYLFFRRFRRGIELDAALITASSAGIIGFARAASMDMALAASFGLAMLGWRAWRESGSRVYLAFFYLFAAVGMLAKGPIAPFLAAVVIVVYAAAMREWRVVLRTLWIPGILLFCAVAAPWYFAVQARNPQFFREFILEHNLARFSSDLYHHRQPFWYYGPVVALALVPWIVFISAALGRIVRVWWAERKSAAPGDTDFEFQFSVFAACWLVVPVVFFSISQSKLPGYILPALPAGALLLTEYLRERGSGEPEPVSKWLAIVHGLVASAVLVPALLLAYLVALHHMPSGKPLMIALAMAVVVAAGIAITLISRFGLRLLRFVTLIPVVLAVAAVLKLGSTAVDQTLSARPVAREIAAMETNPLPLAVFGVSRELEYGLTFYRNQPAIRYERTGLPAQEHLLLAPDSWQPQIAARTSDRRVILLGHFAPQHVSYFWISAAGAKPSMNMSH